MDNDATLADLETTNLTLVTVIVGTVRNAFERHLVRGKGGSAAPPARHPVPCLSGRGPGMSAHPTRDFAAPSLEPV